jgi:hypothetical protein
MIKPAEAGVTPFEIVIVLNWAAGLPASQAP